MFQARARRFGTFARAAGENLAAYSDSPLGWFPTGCAFIGSRLVEDFTSGPHGISQSVALDAESQYTGSIDLGPGRRYVQLYADLGDGATFAWATFDSLLGTVTESDGGTGKIVALDTGGWRLALTATTVAAAAGTYFALQWADQATPGFYPTYQGRGEWLGDLSGFQVEAGAYATGRIPTAGAPASAASDSSGALLVRGGGWIATQVAGLGTGDTVVVERSHDGVVWGPLLATHTGSADFQLGAAAAVRLTCTALATGPELAYLLAVEERHP